MKKLIGILLSAILLSTIICAAPFTVSAAVDEFEPLGTLSGKTGDCTWTLDDNGTLTISGNGKMGDYDYEYYQNEFYVTTAPWGSKIKSVVIENGVTSIGSYAFSSCKNLTSVTIPDTVTSIGDNPFDHCTGLTGVYINDIAAWCRISFASFVDNPLNYAHNLYLNNELITDLIIPDSVTNIGKCEFYGCTCLTSIDIPDSVTGIADGAFYLCTSLTSVTIGNGVTSISGSAFGSCTGLTSVTIPDSVTSIGRNAFIDCSEDLVINCNPGSAAEEYAINLGIKTNNQKFKYSILDDGTVEVTDYLDNFTDIVIPSTYKGKPVNSLSNWFFINNPKIKSVTIPNSVTKIGKGAFYNCVELKTVTMGKNVTEIGANAFEKCLYLENINLSDNLQTIGDEAFYDCRRLKTLDIPATVTSIGEEAFTNCRSLQSLTIPNGVNKLGDESSLGYGMFENCKSLTEIKIPSSVEFIQSNAFDGCSNVTVLGARNSYAESYAAENNISFRAVVDDAPIGDSNGDGNVDVLDAATIQKFASGMADMTNDQQFFADVNNDGVVDILDAAEIQKFAAGIITEFKKKG